MNTETKGTSIGFGGLLTIAFIVLKLIEVIDWNWWWVFAPLWIPICLFLGIAGFVILIALILGR